VRRAEPFEGTVTATRVERAMATFWEKRRRRKEGRKEIEEEQDQA